MCKFCKPNHKTVDGKAVHGDDLISDDGIGANGGMSACIWFDGTLNIETPIDNVFAVIPIKYCPVCGLRV